jgi:hypothetical protein
MAGAGIGCIDLPQGSLISGVDSDGKPWRRPVLPVA